MELDEDFPDINAAPHIRFERFDRDDDLIIEFDNMFSTTGESYWCFYSTLFFIVFVLNVWIDLEGSFYVIELGPYIYKASQG